MATQMKLCDRCGGNLLPSRYDLEQATCLQCGNVVFEPIPQISAAPALLQDGDGRVLHKQAPYGYWGIRGCDDLVENPYEKETIALITALAADDGVSWSWIGRRLSEAGMFNRQGNEWHSSAIRRIAIAHGAPPRARRLGRYRAAKAAQ